MKTEILNTIDELEKEAITHEQARQQVQDLFVVTSSVCPECMSYNKKTGEEITKCWNCGESYRAS